MPFAVHREHGRPAPHFCFLSLHSQHARVDFRGKFSPTTAALPAGATNVASVDGTLALLVTGAGAACGAGVVGLVGLVGPAGGDGGLISGPPDVEAESTGGGATNGVVGGDPAVSRVAMSARKCGS
jgi:hypothetical protein